MRRGFLLSPTPNPEPESEPEPEPEPEGEDESVEYGSDGSITSVLDVANQEEEEETPPEFDIGEPWTPAAQVAVVAAHRPIQLFSFLCAYQVEWEHPFEEFHPEFSIASTDHASFLRVPTGVVRIWMDHEIPPGISPDVEEESLADLADEETFEQLGAVDDWVWKHFAISVWKAAGTTYFQFLRSARRIEEVESEFLMYDTDSNGALFPVRQGPAPSLLGTRRYNYNPDSWWNPDVEPYSSRDTYHNVPAWELHASAEEFHAHDQWIPWDVVFAILFANRNICPQ